MPAPGILVSFDGSRRAERVLARGSAAARDAGASLVVLVLAQVERPSRCCNMQTTFWNAELRRLAAADAERARALLPDGADARVVVREGQGRAAVRAVAAELGCVVLSARGGRGSRRGPFRAPAASG